MTPVRLFPFAASAATLAVAGAVAIMAAAAPLPPPNPVAAYRSWKRVTVRRVPMNAQVAALCEAAPTRSLHDLADFHVYVNSAGERSLTRDRRPVYPVGTLLVKEKFVPKAGEPHLLTVMRKHETGFDSANGDWEYLVQQLPKGKLKAPATADTCRSCHRKVRDRDFVYRSYLPANVLHGLR